MTPFDPNELVELTLKLLSIRGESKNERKIADFVISFCRELGLEVVEDEAAQFTQGNAGNILIKAPDTSSSNDYFLLNSHLDTVVPTHLARVMRGTDRIYSGNDYPLGLDNRAGVAILLTLLKTITTQKISHHNFYVAFTVCEDSGLEGSPHLKIPAEVKVGFTFDASKRPGNFIALASGAYYFTIEVIGKAAHAGVAPEKGTNAIEIAAHAISQINQGWINDHTTLNFGTIQGGDATNVVSKKVMIQGEIRSTTEPEILTELQNIENIFQQEAESRGGSVRFDRQLAFAPYQHDQNSRAFQILESAIRQAGLEPKPIHYTGGSDANVFNKKGLPAINMGIGAQNPHSSDEFIFIEDLIKSTEIALEIVKTD